ncbi:hypothetical protein PPERSA_05747 [Pseudocohnilembus persalinus]|uniref:MORN motif n=1 Tax=Pseudocohnilembus persalinus TaxID=266149 RepID=A0A0V0QI75_PSEPJ|nr:hypothetical protein PPERSA_05747 [Pseudocohnilembus persalinus]|eukprot:KRX01908.1 hypothetical protein PPERSA_05747 [Pseudocohnilembus persalinus]
MSFRPSDQKQVNTQTKINNVQVLQNTTQFYEKQQKESNEQKDYNNPVKIQNQETLQENDNLNQQSTIRDPVVNNVSDDVQQKKYFLKSLIQDQIQKNGKNNTEHTEKNIEKLYQECYQDGSYYYGEKVNSLRHGKGRFYYSDGGFYEGEWKFGKIGQWLDDKFYGQGIMYNESVNKKENEENTDQNQYQQPFDFTNFNQLKEFWYKYDGNFKDDFKEGFGVLYLKNGEKFAGHFCDDVIQGNGKYYSLDGTIYKGVWFQNKLIELK